MKSLSTGWYYRDLKTDTHLTEIQICERAAWMKSSTNLLSKSYCCFTLFIHKLLPFFLKFWLQPKFHLPIFYQSLWSWVENWKVSIILCADLYLSKTYQEISYFLSTYLIILLASIYYLFNSVISFVYDLMNYHASFTLLFHSYDVGFLLKFEVFTIIEINFPVCARIGDLTE